MKTNNSKCPELEGCMNKSQYKTLAEISSFFDKKECKDENSFRTVDIKKRIKSISTKQITRNLNYFRESKIISRPLNKTRNYWTISSDMLKSIQKIRFGVEEMKNYSKEFEKSTCILTSIDPINFFDKYDRANYLNFIKNCIQSNFDIVGNGKNYLELKYVIFQNFGNINIIIEPDENSGKLSIQFKLAISEFNIENFNDYFKVKLGQKDVSLIKSLAGIKQTNSMEIQKMWLNSVLDSALLLILETLDETMEYEITIANKDKMANRKDTILDTIGFDLNKS